MVSRDSIRNVLQTTHPVTDDILRTKVVDLTTSTYLDTSARGLFRAFYLLFQVIRNEGVAMSTFFVKNIF